jgi:hypothetical protein
MPAESPEPDDGAWFASDPVAFGPELLLVEVVLFTGSAAELWLAIPRGEVRDEVSGLLVKLNDVDVARVDDCVDKALRPAPPVVVIGACTLAGWVVTSEAALGAMTGAEIVDAGGNTDCVLFGLLRFVNAPAGAVGNGLVGSSDGSKLSTGARPPGVVPVLGWDKGVWGRLDVSLSPAVLVDDVQLGMIPFPTPTPVNTDLPPAPPTGSELAVAFKLAPVVLFSPNGLVIVILTPWKLSEALMVKPRQDNAWNKVLSMCLELRAPDRKRGYRADWDNFEKMASIAVHTWCAVVECDVRPFVAVVFR